MPAKDNQLFRTGVIVPQSFDSDPLPGMHIRRKIDHARRIPTGASMTDPDGIRVVTEPSREFLKQRQVVDYRSKRESCLKWLMTFGKDPEKAEGYARTTVKRRASRMDIFYRWLWDEEGQYVADITHDHADAFLKQLAYEGRSNADRSNHLKAFQMLMKWRHYELGHDEYEPAGTFYDDDSASQPRDYLTHEESSRIREAALEYESILGYNDLSPDQRDRWKAYLAQRFEKPKVDVSPQDWKCANGWKIPSLVATSLNTGLRPIEIRLDPDIRVIIASAGPVGRRVKAKLDGTHDVVVIDTDAD